MNNKENKFRVWQPIFAAPIVSEFSSSACRVLEVLAKKYKKEHYLNNTGSFNQFRTQNDNVHKFNTEMSNVGQIIVQETVPYTSETTNNSEKILRNIIVNESVPTNSSELVNNAIIDNSEKVLRNIIVNESIINESLPTPTVATKFENFYFNNNCKKRFGNKKVEPNFNNNRSGNSNKTESSLLVLPATEEQSHLNTTNSNLDCHISPNNDDNSNPITSEIDRWFDSNIFVFDEDVPETIFEPQNVNKATRNWPENWYDSNIFVCTENESINRVSKPPSVPDQVPKSTTESKIIRHFKKAYILEVSKEKVDIPKTKQIKLTNMNRFSTAAETALPKNRFAQYKYVKRTDDTENLQNDIPKSINSHKLIQTMIAKDLDSNRMKFKKPRFETIKQTVEKWNEENQLEIVNRNRSIKDFFPIKKPFKDDPNINIKKSELTLKKRSVSNNEKKLPPKQCSDSNKDDKKLPPKKRILNLKQKMHLTPKKLNQLVLVDQHFDVTILEENDLDQFCSQLLENIPVEICFNLIYREGFTQLNKPLKKNTPIRNYKPTQLLLSISFDNTSTQKYYSIPFPTTNCKTNFSKLLNICFTLPIRKFCYESQELLISLFNNFDINVKYDDIQCKWNLMDVQIGCWLINSNMLLKCFNDTLINLNVQPLFDIHSDDIIQRGCYYLILLSQVGEKLMNMLEKVRLWTLFIDLEMKLVPILAGMRYRGIRVDRVSLEQIKKQLGEEIKKIETNAYTVIGKQFNINSTIELRSILYGELKLDQLSGIDIKRTDIRGTKSTSESMLKMLQKSHPLPNIIIEYRKLNKIQTAYIEPLIQCIQNDVVHTTWEQSSAATGRLASSNPNLQSIPKQNYLIKSEDKVINLRSLFTARDDYTFLVIDFQQIEFRLFAHLSNDTNLIEIFQKNTDIFMTLTEQLQTLDSINVDIDRGKMKRILYGIMYGAGPVKLSHELDIDIQIANKIYGFIIGKFPVLKSYPSNVLEECRAFGYLTTLTGRRRYFPNILHSNLKLQMQSERQAVNFAIQGSAADVCKLVMIRIENILAEKKYDSHLLLQIHDELLWEIHDNCLQDVTSLIKYLLSDLNQICGAYFELSVPFPVTIHCAKTWSTTTV